MLLFISTIRNKQSTQCEKPGELTPTHPVLNSHGVAGEVTASNLQKDLMEMLMFLSFRDTFRVVVFFQMSKLNNFTNVKNTINILVVSSEAENNRAPAPKQGKLILKAVNQNET